MRRHRFFREAATFAEDHAQNQCRPTGGHVNDRAAREVNRLNRSSGVPHAVHRAVDAPDHVGEREINDHHPESDEQQDG